MHERQVKPLVIVKMPPNFENFLIFEFEFNKAIGWLIMKFLKFLKFEFNEDNLQFG